MGGGLSTSVPRSARCRVGRSRTALYECSLATGAHDKFKNRTVLHGRGRVGEDSHARNIPARVMFICTVAPRRPVGMGACVAGGLGFSMPGPAQRRVGRSRTALPVGWRSGLGQRAGRRQSSGGLGTGARGEYLVRRGLCKCGIEENEVSCRPIGVGACMADGHDNSVPEPARWRVGRSRTALHGCGRVREDGHA